MTTRRSQRRGQPLLVLTVIMLCWMGARAFVWHADHAGAVVPVVALSPLRGRGATVRKDEAPMLRAERKALADAAVGRARLRAGPDALLLVDHRPFSRPLRSSGQAALPVPSDPVVRRASPSLAAAAALPEVPPAAAFLVPFPPPPVRTETRAERRWSADAWILVRRGGGAASVGPSVAAYGASQAGAVLRYRLWPGNAHRLAGYLRVSGALNGSGEREAALGLSVRPIAALPVFVAGEGRVGHLSGRTVVRPAVMAVTELPPIALAFDGDDRGGGARAEFYLQGGYVGGPGATPFIDGQLRADRQVARIGPVEVRAGGGAWGGAQRGAGRLDLGPAITLQAARGPAAMRLGLDWRFRLMGHAEPASGPALTVSAGF